jgi:hypothetical protein
MPGGTEEQMAVLSLIIQQGDSRVNVYHRLPEVVQDYGTGAEVTSQDIAAQGI